MKKCVKCGQEKNEVDFYKNKRSKDGLDYYCKTCRISTTPKYNTPEVNRQFKNRFQENKKLLLFSKTDCAKCGEDRRYVIHFHHIDPSTKKFSVCTCGTRSRKTVLDEIKKCICLCANCHEEFHHIYGLVPKEPIKAINEYLKL